MVEIDTAMLQVGTLRPTDSRGIPVAAREEARAVRQSRIQVLRDENTK